MFCMETKLILSRRLAAAALLLTPAVACAQDAARVASEGLELVPLLVRLMPGLSPGVIAAGVAIANASLTLILLGLGLSTAWRAFQRWQRGNPPVNVAAANRRGTHRRPPPATSRPSAAAILDRTQHADDEARRRRIRDRFVYVRFDGALKGTADFNSPGKVVKAARLYFEDGRGDRADELLALALKHRPEEHAYWLARLEIRFLLGDGPAFVEISEAFMQVAPDAHEWDEIKRLGVRIAPEALLFAGHASNEADSYGPWPTMPNWIQSSWDLTAEVIASEFHNRMRNRIQEMRENFSLGVAPVTQ